MEKKWMDDGCEKKIVKNKDFMACFGSINLPKADKLGMGKGTCGNEGNERADYLANLAIDENI